MSAEHRNSRRGVAAKDIKNSGEDRRGDAQRAARRGGVRARRGRALREDGRPGGIPQRPLREKARHRAGEVELKRAEAARRDLPDGPLSSATTQARDSRSRRPSSRDVPRGHLGPENRDVSELLLWGAPPCPPAPSQPQREGVRVHRGCARGRSRAITLTYIDGICLKRSWEVLRERGCSGGHRRQLHRRPGGHRLRGGLHRVGGLVARVLLVAQGARGLSAVRLVTGDKCAGMLGALERCSRGIALALHGPLLPKRWEGCP